MTLTDNASITGANKQHNDLIAQVQLDIIESRGRNETRFTSLVEQVQDASVI